VKIIETRDAVYQHVLGRHAHSVLVPTMGALHQGHRELIRVAREQAGIGGEVAVSIFVNPLQFEPGSDFDKYPRPQTEDEEVCREAGVDLLFRPTADEMYSRDRSVYVEEISLSTVLCGASRPGHFRGVCTVVSKLFNLLMPNVAVFGEKDYQQLAIIRRMVRDLNFPVAIVGVPTVRDADGLALSSRNRYLSGDERAQATVLRRAALAAQRLAQGGETSASKLIEAAGEAIASAGGARVDYISLIDAETLQPLQTLRPKSILVLAVFIGGTRLIDNLQIA
jgi:pantoate--beta-alanine ligase